MEFIRPSDTDLKLSRLVFGCEQLGGTDWGKVDEKDLQSAVLHAVERGINTFDVSNVYGLGRAEKLLAQVLGKKRHDLNIITKGGVNWELSMGGDRAKTFFDSTPAHIIEAIEGSLSRLRLESIPIYLLHWPDPQTPIEESMEALQKCQKEGKIRYIGLSNFSIRQLQEARNYVDILVSEFQYNLIDRTPEEEVLPYCHDSGILPISYGALAQGFLTGKYRASYKFGKDDRRHRLPHFQGNQSAAFQVLSRLEGYAKSANKGLPEVALRWILDKEPMSCTIFGAKSAKQVESNLKAMDWKLLKSDIDFLDGVI